MLVPAKYKLTGPLDVPLPNKQRHAFDPKWSMHVRDVCNCCALFSEDLSMDLSLIPCDIEDSKPRNPMHPPQASKPGTLTPIKEESSASSKSSSRYSS